MRPAPKVLALAAASLLATGAAAGCSETKRGEVVLAFQTDMKVPDDIDTVALRVTVDGVPKFSQTYQVGPSGVKLPSTLALVDETNSAVAVSIRLLALKGGQKPRVLRDVVTTVPPRRSALLRLGFDYLCWGDASLTKDSQSSVGSADTAAEGVTSPCGTQGTCVAGACQDARVDSALLPDFVPGDVFGGGDENGGGTCFDVTACFAGAQPVTVDPACSIAAPADLSRTSVALRLPLGSEGICDQTACWVALDAESPAGWKAQGGRIQLPQAVCDRKLPVVITQACAQKTAKIPPCGPWSSVTTPTTPTAPDGGPQADAGPDAPPVVLPAKLLYQAPMETFGSVVVGGQTLFFFTNGSMGATVRRCAIPGCSTVSTLTTVGQGLGLIAASATHVAFSTVGFFDFVQSCLDMAPCTPVPMFPSNAGVRGLSVNGAGVSVIREYMGTSTVEFCNDWTSGCSSGATVVTTLPMGAIALDVVVDANGVRYWIDDQSGGRIARCTSWPCPTPTEVKTGIGDAVQLRLTGNVLSWVDVSGNLWDCDANNCAGQILAPAVEGYAPAPTGAGHVLYRTGMPGTLAWFRSMDKTEIPLPPPVGQVSGAAVDPQGNYYVVANTGSDLQVWRYPLP
jgi:hypothetical protein